MSIEFTDKKDRQRWIEQWKDKWRMFEDLYYRDKKNVFKDDFEGSSLGLLTREDVRYIVINRLAFEHLFGVRYGY